MATVLSTMDTHITLYTAHHCPFAHRVQIALRELGLQFETALVDITVPRTPDYLAINPSGMVPALAYNGHILTESGLISQFLVDSHTSHLYPSTVGLDGAFQRFKIGYFVDTFFSKAHKSFDAIVFSPIAGAKASMAEEYISAVVKHVEPLLADAEPFLGGSNRLTLGEVRIRQRRLHQQLGRKTLTRVVSQVMTGPFVLRVLTLPKYEQIVPSFILPALQNRAPCFWRWAQAVVLEESVTAVWNEANVVRRTLEKIEKTIGSK